MDFDQRHAGFEIDDCQRVAAEWNGKRIKRNRIAVAVSKIPCGTMTTRGPAAFEFKTSQASLNRRRKIFR